MFHILYNVQQLRSIIIRPKLLSYVQFVFFIEPFLLPKYVVQRLLPLSTITLQPNKLWVRVCTNPYYCSVCHCAYLFVQAKRPVTRSDSLCVFVFLLLGTGRYLKMCKCSEQYDKQNQTCYILLTDTIKIIEQHMDKIMTSKQLAEEF